MVIDKYIKSSIGIFGDDYYTEKLSRVAPIPMEQAKLAIPGLIVGHNDLTAYGKFQESAKWECLEKVYGTIDVYFHGASMDRAKAIMLMDRKIQNKIDDFHNVAELVIPSKNNVQKKLEEIWFKDHDRFHNEAMLMLYSELYDILSDVNQSDKPSLCELYLEHFLKLPFSLELRVAFARITKPIKNKINNRERLIDSIKDILSDKKYSESEKDNILKHIS